MQEPFSDFQDDLQMPQTTPSRRHIGCHYPWEVELSTKPQPRTPTSLTHSHSPRMSSNNNHNRNDNGHRNDDGSGSGGGYDSLFDDTPPGANNLPPMVSGIGEQLGLAVTDAEPLLTLPTNTTMPDASMSALHLRESNEFARPPTAQDAQSELHPPQSSNFTGVAELPSREPRHRGMFCCPVDERASGGNFQPRSDNSKVCRFRDNANWWHLLRLFIEFANGGEVLLAPADVSNSPELTVHLVPVIEFQEQQYDPQYSAEQQRSMPLPTADFNFGIRYVGKRRWVYEQIPYETGNVGLGEQLKLELDRIIKCEQHNKCWQISIFR